MEKKLDCTQKQQNSWTASEKIEITKVLTILINGQKTYGKEYSLTDTFAYYQLKLESRFNGAQVIYAVDKYTDFKADIPTPADIIAILVPEVPKIPLAQYIAAQRAQERNNYPRFSAEAYMIRAYDKQNEDHFENTLIENKKIKALVGNSVKSIDSKVKETVVRISDDDTIALGILMPEPAFFNAVGKHDGEIKAIAKELMVPIGAVILRGEKLGVKFKKETTLEGKE